MSRSETVAALLTERAASLREGGGPPLEVEGERGTLKFAIVFCFRILPQSPTVPAPSRREP